MSSITFEQLFLTATPARPDGSARLSARAAWQATLTDALLVDIRSPQQRAAHGEVPGALTDADLRAGLPPGALVIVLSQRGFRSTTAAAALRRLGHPHATDVVGGFAAWRAAGMPVA